MPKKWIDTPLAPLIVSGERSDQRPYSSIMEGVELRGGELRANGGIQTESYHVKKLSAIIYAQITNSERGAVSLFDKTGADSASVGTQVSLPYGTAGTPVTVDVSEINTFVSAVGVTVGVRAFGENDSGDPVSISISKSGSPTYESSILEPPTPVLHFLYESGRTANPLQVPEYNDDYPIGDDEFDHTRDRDPDNSSGSGTGGGDRSGRNTEFA